MNERMQTSSEEQKKFFTQVKKISGATWQELAKQYCLHDRTLREWARGKYTPSYETVIDLAKTYGIPLPEDYKILPPHWHIPIYARKGALARVALHGAPGTIESRRKGGRISQERRQQNPEAYNNSKWIIRKTAPKFTPSENLAELCGILLGDGGITTNQIKVTLHRIDDAAYAIKVKKLMHSIFGEEPSEYLRQNVRILSISGIAIVEALKTIGLAPGNKIKMQIAIPTWILASQAFARACVRGLIDTDGSIYAHAHTVNNQSYVHRGLTFTSHSLPMIQNVQEILKNEGLYVKTEGPHKLYIYSKDTITRYMSVIGTSNPKHAKKWQDYLKRNLK